MTEISLQNVKKSFISEEGQGVDLFNSISLTINADEIVTILGPNGSGKSTLLNLVAGTVTPDSGIVSISVQHSDNARIGYVWQNYRESLLPWFNVTENITFPLKIKGIPQNERKVIAVNLLSRFGRSIDPKKKIFELSGGQQQLIAILRALTINPDMLLLDEPFSALDQQSRWAMAMHVENIWMDRKIPVLFVSHDVDEAISLADRIVLLSRKEKGIIKVIKNSSPRPRPPESLNSIEHLRCRQEIIEFLLEEGVL